MHGLSHLSASLPGHSRDLAASTPRSPCRHAKPCSNSMESELHRLHAEVAMLRVRYSTRLGPCKHLPSESCSCTVYPYSAIGRLCNHALFAASFALPIALGCLISRLYGLHTVSSLKGALLSLSYLSCEKLSCQHLNCIPHGRRSRMIAMHSRLQRP